MMKTLAEHRPDLVEEWDFEKNGFGPDEVSYGSRKKVWWRGACGHEWQMRVDSRTNAKTLCGCPFCRRSKKSQSFIETHPGLAQEWHSTKNAGLDPKSMTAGAHQIVWWRGSCGHEWEASIHNRSKPRRPSGCPYCNNRKPDSTNSLASLFPRIAGELHHTKNGSLTAQDIVATTYRSVWWQGECGHEWQSKVRTRTRPERPAGCPICKESRGEREVELALQELGVPYSKQVRYTDCRFKKPLPFDFEVGTPQGPMLIEYHGLQHYEPVHFGGDAAAIHQGTLIRDEIKRKWCETKGHKLVVIPYTEFDNIRRILRQEVRNP